MSSDAGTVLVVPCYNEADRLDPDAFLDALSADARLGFVMVDDGSTDATADVLERLARDAPDIRVVTLERNRGKGEAVRQGLLRALDLEPEFVGYWDADLSTPLSALEDLRATLRRDPGVEWAIGSRVQLLGRSIVRRAVRHYQGRVFATVASCALALPVYDTQCGAKLFRAGPDLPDLLSEPFLSRWAFDVELLARRLASDPAARIVEVPLREWRDVPGSRVEPGAALRAGLDLLRIRRRYGPVGAYARQAGA